MSHRAVSRLPGPETIRPDPALVERYMAQGFWGQETLADVIRRQASRSPGQVAFIEGDRQMTWREYEERSTRIALALISHGFQPGERIGVQLPDGPSVHAVYSGAEKAGLTVVGLGMRAGGEEVHHLLQASQAVALVTEAAGHGREAAGLFQRLLAEGVPLRAHLLMPDLEQSAPAGGAGALIDERRLGPNDLYLLNSTSGTTGLPKLVTQFQNRWICFHRLAVEAGALTSGDVFMSLIPAPYGFAQWTARFTPTLLGAPVVVMSRFDPERCLAQIERHRVSVLMCVSTQFVMLLNSPDLRRRDLSSLRCMFTGGEAVPFDRAAEFEDLTGASVLQFYGSNETGALSYTGLSDDRSTRLQTCGRVIPWMQVRLFDGDGLDVTASGGPGQPGCKGPLTSLGYLGDAGANADLFTEDGWMLTGDIAVLEEGRLRLVGRKGDFIIRGGKNVSAAAVEAGVGSHPAVALAAAVAMPDPVFGERVACYVVLKPDAALGLEDLRRHLKERGASIESWPERLIVVDALPMSSGAKVAKGLLRDDVRRRLLAEGTGAR